MATCKTLALFTLCCWACTADGPTDRMGPGEDLDPWAKRWWIEKSARYLWADAELTPSELETFAELPRDQVVAAMMADSRFGDGVLDFNLNYLGWPVASLRAPDLVSRKVQYRSRISWRPQAVVSARAVLEDGDYFSLFDSEGPWMMPPLSDNVFLLGGSLPDGVPFTPDNVRATNLIHLKNVFDAMRAPLHPPDGTPVDMGTACTAFFSYFFEPLNYWVSIGWTTFDLGLIWENGTYVDLLEPRFFSLLNGTGIDFSTCSTLPPSVLEEQIDRIWDFVMAVEQFTKAAPPAPQTRFEDLKLIDGADYGFGGRPLFAPTAIRSYENTSTNLNRRRAAQVLKTYFCDDLTPITIPSEDSDGTVHGTQTSCKACHFKLDPMAGFFRYTDAFGQTTKERTDMFFNDGVFLQDQAYQQYVQQWRAPEGSQREWNVGFIRSASEPERNVYGESFEDLTSILRQAPEVRACLARRMGEYYFGKEQTVDPAWLSRLADKLQPGPHSSRVFKEVVSELVLSETFSTRDRDPAQCYDRDGEETDGALPCAVAHLVAKNCADCHDSTDAGGHLDLTRWIDTGSGFGFPHLDRDGVQHPPAETFARMIERITSTDKKRAMPFMQYMETRERQDLYLWLQKQAEARP